MLYAVKYQQPSGAWVTDLTTSNAIKASGTATALRKLGRIVKIVKL